MSFGGGSSGGNQATTQGVTPYAAAEPALGQILSESTNLYGQGVGATGYVPPSLHGVDVVAIAFEFNFHGGSMGYAVGEKFTRAAGVALENGIPLICFAASGGARMQEALISLMQMAKTSAVIERMKAAGVPYVSVMTDPIYGGVSASLALLGDINVAEPDARAGFAGPNIIEQTIRQKLPRGFQRSEFLLEHGAIDMIIPRSEMRDTLARVLGKFTNAQIAS